MSPRRYLAVRFDVTDLTDDEVGELAVEVAVQAEASERHRSVPPPELETVEHDDDDDDESTPHNRKAQS